MEWEKVKLGKICNPTQWITISKSALKEDGYPVYGANGIIGYYDEYNHIEPTLLIGCRGTCGALHISEPYSYTSGNAMALDNLSDRVNVKYLYYYLLNRGFKDILSGGVQKQITQTSLSRIEIPLPPLSIQKEIVERLDKADAIRQKAQELVAQYDHLAQALFIDLFGDPVTNEKGWERKKLGDLGDFKNGLNYNKSDLGEELLILGVGDFKNNWLLSNISDFSKIFIKDLPSSDYYLQKGDVVFVRSNGNKELIGRAVLINPNSENIVFSGFCIRFRSNCSNLNSVFFSKIFHNEMFRKEMLKNGRGANIQNINQEMLKLLQIPLPPISLQNQFAEMIENIEAQKAKAKKQAEESENLFQALLQEAFGGK